MIDTTGLDRNFRFLVLKVTKQIEYIQHALAHPQKDVVRRMKTRDDYIDHLKSIIEKKCFSLLRRSGDLDKAKVDSLQSMNVITANLERIADHAVSVARQTTHFTAPTFFHRYEYRPFFDTIFEALGLVLDAYEHRDAAKALQLCRSEVEIDRLYKEQFERILAEMQSSGDVPNLVTSLFIFHYLERMGDALLNIGEAILFYKLGEKLKLNQYQYLRETLAAVRGDEDATEQVGFEGIWETRSGCRIAKVTEVSDQFDENQEVIYKEGAKEKIRNEKDGIERWRQAAPSVPPRVVEYQEGEQDAAILVEFLEGKNLQEILLEAEDELLDEALGRTQDTLRKTWLETKEDEPVKAAFLRQLAARLEDVYTVHPKSQGIDQQIGSVAIPGFEKLLKRNLHADDALAAPFSVLGHGDFNLDNIIYNPERRSVHFVDLHRSRQLDLVQDVSVFLVSNFRLPVFDRQRRQRTNNAALSFYRFAARFAREQGDPTFEARLALGIVRSLITSTRFEFSRTFADEMVGRAVYLLRQLESHDDRWESFALPTELLLY